jgi:hypothetical protein
VTAAADLESRWLAPIAVIATAAQVYASNIGQWAGPGLAFLVITSASLLAIQWVRLWMISHDLTPWEWLDSRRGAFDPAFYRWRRLPARTAPSTPPSHPQKTGKTNPPTGNSE